MNENEIGQAFLGRKVCKYLDNNGQRYTVNISGFNPTNLERFVELTRNPNPLGGDPTITLTKREAEKKLSLASAS